MYITHLCDPFKSIILSAPFGRVNVVTVNTFTISINSLHAYICISERILSTIKIQNNPRNQSKQIPYVIAIIYANYLCSVYSGKISPIEATKTISDFMMLNRKEEKRGQAYVIIMTDLVTKLTLSRPSRACSC